MAVAALIDRWVAQTTRTQTESKKNANIHYCSLTKKYDDFEEFLVTKLSLRRPSRKEILKFVGNVNESRSNREWLRRSKICSYITARRAIAYCWTKENQQQKRENNRGDWKEKVWLKFYTLSHSWIANLWIMYCCGFQMCVLRKFSALLAFP